MSCTIGGETRQKGHQIWGKRPVGAVEIAAIIPRKPSLCALSDEGKHDLRTQQFKVGNKTSSNPRPERSIRPSGADDLLLASDPGLRYACPGLFSMAPYGSRPMGCSWIADAEIHLEHFRFTSLHQKSREDGFFLRKKPLSSMDSVNTRIENAVEPPTF